MLFKKFKLFAVLSAFQSFHTAANPHFFTLNCRYIRRRAKEAFSATPEASKAEELMQTARKEYEVVKRQAIVFSLYARKQKNVMVSWIFLINC
jgi:hypothetical protein